MYGSSDDGRNFTTADYSHENMGDWEKVFVGPPARRATGAPQPVGYPDVVYVCANSPFEVSGPGRQCYRSLDGGLTFSSAGFVFPSASSPADVCPALASNGGVVDSQGATYRPVSCSKGGLRRREPRRGQHLHLRGSLQLAVDTADNLYGMWVANDQIYLARSSDHARSWSIPLAVTAPGLHTVTRAAFAACGPGQLAITYYASHDASAKKLSAFITQTADGLDAQPLFYSDAINDEAHPIYQDEGVSGGTPRADFIGGACGSAGTFWAGVVKQLAPADSSGHVATTGYVGRLVFGAATPTVIESGSALAAPGA